MCRIISHYVLCHNCRRTRLYDETITQCPQLCWDRMVVTRDTMPREDRFRQVACPRCTADAFRNHRDFRLFMDRSTALWWGHGRRRA